MDREKINNCSHKRAPFLVVGFFVPAHCWPSLILLSLSIYFVTAVLNDWCKHRPNDWMDGGVHFFSPSKENTDMFTATCTNFLYSEAMLQERISWYNLDLLVSFNIPEHFHPLFIPKSLWLQTVFSLPSHFFFLIWSPLVFFCFCTSVASFYFLHLFFSHHTQLKIKTKKPTKPCPCFFSGKFSLLCTVQSLPLRAILQTLKHLPLFTSWGQSV